jgi:hypothetical protein
MIERNPRRWQHGDVDVLDHPKMKKLSRALRTDELASYVKHHDHNN